MSSGERLAAIVEMDEDRLIVSFSGPTAATRMILCSVGFARAMLPARIADAFAELPSPVMKAPPSDSPMAAILRAEDIVDALGTGRCSVAAAAMLPEPQSLACLCWLAAPPATALESQHRLDDLYRHVIHRCRSGAPPTEQAANAAVAWARALRRPCAERLFRDAFAVEGPPTWIASDVPGEQLFHAIAEGNLAGAVRALSSGAPLEAKGEQIFAGGDLGCCYWSPLAFAAYSCRHRKGCESIAALLLAARADACRPCEGPCQRTPLMLAAAGGNADVCRLLALAGAEVRARCNTGSRPTALDMGTNGTARAIREAHALRASLDGKGDDQMSSAPCSTRAQPKRGSGASVTATQQRLALLAIAQRSSAPSKGSGKARRSGNR